MSLVSSPSDSSATSPLGRAVWALRTAAEYVLSRRFRVLLLVRNAYERLLSHSSVMSAVGRDLRTMMRLLVRWATRSYRRVSWAPLVVVAGTLLYFVLPLDLIPDALGAVGFIDDVSVVSAAVESVRAELQRFRAWEQQALPE